MTDEKSLAFDSPEARAKATGSGDPLDRIAVRDFVTEVDIGAFQSERGVRQRVRFNVVLEVSRSAAAKYDDVDQVLSYDTITDAIEHQLAVERLNLLETLAERIADEILSNPRAQRVFIRIEKLDRIPGALGIEIVRSRKNAENLSVLHAEEKPEPVKIAPRVIFMPNSILHGEGQKVWLESLKGLSEPTIICVEMTESQPEHTTIAQANRRIELLAIEQNAWMLAAKDKRFVVVDSRTELDWAIHHGQISVWAPSKMVLDAVDGPQMEGTEPLKMAIWLAGQFGADNVTVLDPTGAAQQDDNIVPVTHPANLTG